MNVLFLPGGKYTDGKIYKIHENKLSSKENKGLKHLLTSKIKLETKNSMNLH